MERVIETKGLTKYYGKSRGIIDLDLDVQQGEVFGFLGPNGAGKTTTIRVLLDFIRPTSGTARVLGMDAHTHSPEIRVHLGYLPGELSMYENITGQDLLIYFANLRGGVDWAYARSIAERLDLDLSRKIRTLSKGNKQKVGLVQAFMHRPRLLVLDEPTSGLDPLVQQEFYRMLQEVKDEGHTVFLSSHVMAEVERTADRVGIVREGRLVLVDEVRAIKARAVRRLEIHFGEIVPKEAFANLPGVRDLVIENDLASVVQCTVDGPIDRLIKAAAQYNVVNIVSHDPDLEELFLTYYRHEEKEVAGHAA